MAEGNSLKVIGLFGQSGSGKDTAAEVLSAKGYATMAFATPMKIFCKDVFGFTDEQLYGASEERNVADPRWGFSPRTALIELGTTFMHRLDDAAWVKYALRKIASLPFGDYVITDVRFQTEIDHLRQFGANVVKITRPDRVAASHDDHVSEAGQAAIDDSTFDAVIVNDGTISVLHKKILAFESTVKDI